MPEHSNGWTLDTLDAYLSSRLESLDKLFSEKMSANQKSIDTLSFNINKALEKADTGFVEFRQIILDQSNNFLTRREYESKHDIISNQFTRLDNRFVKIETDNNNIQIMLKQLSTNSDRLTALETSKITKKEGLNSMSSVIVVVGVVSTIMVTLANVLLHMGAFFGFK